MVVIVTIEGKSAGSPSMKMEFQVDKICVYFQTK